MPRRPFAVLAVALALPLLVAACGGSTSSSSASPAGSSASATVNERDTDLGAVLVNADGRTLYLFEKDSAGTSACTDGCADAWPPLTTTGSPTAGDGVDAAKLGTIDRGGGVVQVTYNGHPLYTYAKDAKPGDTTGQDVGGVWYVVGTNGDKLEKEEGATTSGGYGY
jgi:predicted lipoprotein with Yx(FWY)xxD motif